MLSLSFVQCGTNYNDDYVDDDDDDDDDDVVAVIDNHDDDDGAVLKCHIVRNLFLTKKVWSSEMIMI